MYKIICKKDNCKNQNVVYYVPEPTNPTICGGCKNELQPIKLSKTEFEKIFDYDPFASNEEN